MPEPSSSPDLPWWMKPGFGAWSAPQELFQPINPGWTFGNVIVSAQNSSAPDTEREIVSSDSYGRQIGKLLDAVVVLIGAQGGASGVKAFDEVLALRDRVERTKQEAAARRVDQFFRDLALLKAGGSPEYETRLAELLEASKAD